MAVKIYSDLLTVLVDKVFVLSVKLVETSDSECLEYIGCLSVQLFLFSAVCWYRLNYSNTESGIIPIQRPPTLNIWNSLWVSDSILWHHFLIGLFNLYRFFTFGMLSNGSFYMLITTWLPLKVGGFVSDISSHYLIYYLYFKIPG